MRVLGQRVEARLAAHAAHANDGDFALEVDESFQDQRHAAEFLERGLEVRSLAQHALALAVVAEAAGLEHGGQADFFHCRAQVGEAVDGRKRRGRDVQRLEQLLFQQTVLGFFQEVDAGAERPGHAFAHRLHRHVLDVEGDHVHVLGKLAQLFRVPELAEDDLAHLPAGGVLALVEEDEAQAQRIAREGQHAAELAGADNANTFCVFCAHGFREMNEPGRTNRQYGPGFQSRGSGFARTVSVWLRRNSSSAARMSSCSFDNIEAASSAALVAPARPIAIVPTGTPAGICTMESSESMPFSALDCTGTPSTGSEVLAATMPGRWAAPPAPAMITFNPRSRAVSAYSNSRSGVRCADTTRHSYGMFRDSSIETACWRVSQSDFEPMMTPTSAFIRVVYLSLRAAQPSSCIPARSSRKSSRWRRGGWPWARSLAAAVSSWRRRCRSAR